MARCCLLNKHTHVEIEFTMPHQHVLIGIRGFLCDFKGIIQHSVCETDIESIEIAIKIREDDSDILHELIDRVCLLLNAMHDLPCFAIATSYHEHDFPTLTKVYVEGQFIVIQTKSQLDNGATYRRRMDF